VAGSNPGYTYFMDKHTHCILTKQTESQIILAVNALKRVGVSCSYKFINLIELYGLFVASDDARGAYVRAQNEGII
jgi:hypothetical protein